MFGFCNIKFYFIFLILIFLIDEEKRGCGNGEIIGGGVVGCVYVRVLVLLCV